MVVVVEAEPVATTDQFTGLDAGVHVEVDRDVNERQRCGQTEFIGEDEFRRRSGEHVKATANRKRPVLPVFSS